MTISEKDRGILRELAKKQMELARSERNTRLYEEWVAYGKSRVPARPMITVELWTFAEQVLTPLLRCEGERARAIESRMRSPMVNFELFGDDSLVPDYWGVSLHRSFRPEFLNRIDETVMFQKLGKDCIGGIVRIQLERVAHRLEDRRITLTFDESAVNFLCEKGYDPAFGARPVKRAVQTWVENPLSKELLAGKFAEGSSIKVTAGSNSLLFA